MIATLSGDYCTSNLWALLVTHEEIDRPSAKPLHGPPVFRFNSITGEQTLTVRLPDIVTLTPVSLEQIAAPLRESVLSLMTNDVSSGAEKVPLAEIEAVLQLAVDDNEVQPAHHVLALKTLRTRNREDAFDTLANHLFPLLEHADTAAGTILLSEITQHADDNPAALEPFVSDLISLAAGTAYTEGAAKCLATLAEDDPSHVLDAVPALATAADSKNEDARKWAVYAFSKIAEAYPEELFPALDSLVDAISADDENLRMNALSALGQVTGSYPDAAATVVDDLAELLTSEHAAVRGNETGLLADIAQEHPEPVIEHAASIAQRLTDESADVRRNAAITLIRAGGADPQVVKAEHEHLEAALNDPDPAVRANACTLIGNAHAPVTIDRLHSLRENDPDERVRDQAAWAMERLQ